MFRRKPSQAEIAAQKERRAQMHTARIAAMLEQEPSFQLLSFDQLCWIDPFSAKVIEAPFGWKETAIAFLRDNQHWHERKPKDLNELYKARWMYHLRHHLTEDKRLRLVGKGGKWLNPISGTWSRNIVISKQITLENAAAMAMELAQNPAHTPDDFRDLASLEKIKGLDKFRGIQMM